MAIPVGPVPAHECDMGERLGVVHQRGVRAGNGGTAGRVVDAGGPSELWAGCVEAVEVGRNLPRERVVALDDLEERRFLAVEVVIGALDHDDFQAVEPICALEFAYGAVDRSQLWGVLRLRCDDDATCADALRSDHRALEHHVRVRL